MNGIVMEYENDAYIVQLVHKLNFVNLCIAKLVSSILFGANIFV